jgi:hypothetical protein
LERLGRIGPRLFGRFLFGLGDILFPEPVGVGSDRGPFIESKTIEDIKAERAAQDARQQERNDVLSENPPAEIQPQPRQAPVIEEIVTTAPRPAPQPGVQTGPLTLPGTNLPAPIIGLPFLPFALPSGSPAPVSPPFPGVESPPIPESPPVPGPGPEIVPGTPPVINLTPPAPPPPLPGPGGLTRSEVGRLELPQPRRQPQTRQDRKCKEVKRKRKRDKCFEGFYEERFGRTIFTDWRQVDCFTGRTIKQPTAEIIKFPGAGKVEGDI